MKTSPRVAKYGEAARNRELQILADASNRMAKTLNMPVQPGFITLARRAYSEAEWEWERRNVALRSNAEIDRANILRNRRIAGRDTCLNTEGIKAQPAV